MEQKWSKNGAKMENNYENVFAPSYGKGTETQNNFLPGQLDHF